MCMGSGSPGISGGIIASLKGGDEIIVREGFGFPKAEEDTKQIIAFVQGFSALTTDGVRLNCKDGMGISPTGNHVDNFQLSEEACRIIEEINKR